MSEVKSTVRAIVRATGSGWANVEVEGGGCGRCHEEGGCGGQNLTQMFCAGPKTYRVEDPLGAQVGERVEIAINAGNVRRSANVAYVFPLLAALVSAIAGHQLSGEPGAIVGLALGLAGGFIYLYLQTRQALGKIAGHPHIVSRSLLKQEANRP